MNEDQRISTKSAARYTSSFLAQYKHCYPERGKPSFVCTDEEKNRGKIVDIDIMEEVEFENFNYYYSSALKDSLYYTPEDFNSADLVACEDEIEDVLEGVDGDVDATNVVAGLGTVNTAVDATRDTVDEVVGVPASTVMHHTENSYTVVWDEVDKKHVQPAAQMISDAPLVVKEYSKYCYIADNLSYRAHPIRESSSGEAFVPAHLAEIIPDRPFMQPFQDPSPRNNLRCVVDLMRHRDDMGGRVVFAQAATEDMGHEADVFSNATLNDDDWDEQVDVSQVADEDLRSKANVISNLLSTVLSHDSDVLHTIPSCDKHTKEAKAFVEVPASEAMHYIGSPYAVALDEVDKKYVQLGVQMIYDASLVLNEYSGYCYVADNMSSSSG